MKCIVPNCCSESSRSARSEGITFHKFPTDQETLVTWQKSLGLTSYNASEDNIICSEHFHERDFCTTNYGLRKLHQDAVPVNLNPETPVAEKVCRICFIMDSNMKDLQKYCKSFEDVTGIPSEVGDGRLPQHICWECAAQLATAANFRAKALLSDGLLHNLLNRDTELKFCYLKPIRRVLKDHGFESKLKQETFDIEHFDTYISDSSVDIKPKHIDHNYTDNDLHEIIDESVIKNNDNDDNDEIVDENVTENNYSGNDTENNYSGNDTENNYSGNDTENNYSGNGTENNYINDIKDIKIDTVEIEEFDRTEFLDMNEYIISNTGKEVNFDSKNIIHNTVDDIEINSDSKNFINITMDTENPDCNAENYMEIQRFENNDGSQDRREYKPERPELFEINQFQPATAIDFRYASNLVQPSNVEDSVPFQKNSTARPFPTIDISQFQPVLKSISNKLDEMEKAVPSKKGKVKKAPTIDFRYARNLLKRLGHIQDPPPVNQRKNVAKEINPIIKKRTRDKVFECFPIKNGDITVYYIRNTTDCEIPAEVSELESHFTITPLTQDRLLQEMESRKDKAAYELAPYKCAECYLTFPDEERYNLHMINHDKRFGLHQCGICKIFKKSGCHMRHHMKITHSFELACKKCNWQTRNRRTAHGHIKFHEGHTYTCQNCPKTFSSRTSYWSHVRLNHICDVVCDICGYAYVSNAGLNFHKKKAHKFLVLNPPPFEGPHCETCDIKFLSQAAYDTHLKCSSKHLQSENDPARIRNERGQHIHRKHGDRTQRPRNCTIICEQCGKVCGNVQAYRAHFLNIHRGVAPTQKQNQQLCSVMCDQCGKNYQSKYLLRAHQWVHTGQKLFQCDVCKKSFSQKINLSRHIEIAHMNVERKYTCELCGKNYTENNNLKRHIKNAHANDKRCKCLQCDRTFVFQSELNAHVEYIHNKKPYPKRKNPRKKPVKSEQ